MSNLEKYSVDGNKIHAINFDPKGNTIEVVFNESVPQTEIEKIKNLSLGSQTYNVIVKTVPSK